ncbi:MAG: ROK family protein [Armatimonadetes bacterium]|nr:ROK family protein [Armatimonadota bacterium]
MKDYSVGIDLGGTKLVLWCEGAEELSQTGVSFTPEELLLHLKSFIKRHGINPARIGLAIPGLVEKSGRVVACDVLPSFQGWEARYAIQDICTQVAVLNDVKAALLEEMHDTPPNITGGVIMIGTAIGAAFITNGKPLVGASGWAGELGYLPIRFNDKIKRLDEVAGGAAIAALCDVAPTTLALRARAGDPATLCVIAQAGESLGLGLATVINLLNPSCLAIGGGTSELPGYWEAALVSAEQNALPELWRDCTLTKVKAGKRVVVLGAIRAAES